MSEKNLLNGTENILLKLIKDDIEKKTNLFTSSRQQNI